MPAHWQNSWWTEGLTMKSFHFACPGEIFFGANCIAQHPEVFASLGKRAYVITSPFPDGVRNLALEDVTALLKRLNIAWEVCDEVLPDPAVEACAAMLPRVKAFAPDFLVGVGGGSVMDTVKCINILLRYPDGEAYDVLFGKGAHVFGVGGENQGALPFVSVATTAGTGADLTGVAVLTRADIQSKCGTNRRNYARYVFTDPRYVVGSPARLNQATAIDALCHGIEAYLSRDSRDDFMTNLLSERAFALFAEFKDALLRNEMTEEDYTRQALHSMLQGIVIINEVTGVPHGLGYPLSHEFHVPHGLACGVFEGEYLRIFQDQTRVDRVMELLGFSGVDDFCVYIQNILTPHIHIQVTQQEIEAWTDAFCAQQWRLDRHPEPLTREMVKGVYERALAAFIV